MRFPRVEMSCHAQRRRHVFASSQRRSTDKPCMPSSAHSARLLSPQDALDVCLLLHQLPRKRRLHVFVDAQRRITHEPYMPSSAHAARLQIPLDTLDVRLPLPYSTHRRRRRVFIYAQQRRTDKTCSPRNTPAKPTFYGTNTHHLS